MSFIPLTVKEIAEAQESDHSIHKLATDPQYTRHLVENMQVLCKGTSMVLPAALQHRAIVGTIITFNILEQSVLKRHSVLCCIGKVCAIPSGNMSKTVINVKSTNSTNTSILKYQQNLVIQNPWEALCMDLIGPYTLKGQDGTEIDFMCLTMIDPATNWLEIVELPVVETSAIPTGTRGCKGLSTHTTPKMPYFDKSSARISTLVNKTWFSWYPHCQHVIYDNGSEFKLHFEALCDTYGIKHKPTSVKNPQANAILEQVHQVIMAMLHTSELDMAASVDASDIDTFLTNAEWAIHSTYHTVLKPLQAQLFLAGTCCLTFPSLLTESNLGTTGNTRQISTQHRRKNSLRMGLSSRR